MPEINRREYLLHRAATAFDKSVDPFSLDWLIDHGITADECISLSESIAAILFGYLAAPKAVQDDVMGAYASMRLLVTE